MSPKSGSPTTTHLHQRFGHIASNERHSATTDEYTKTVALLGLASREEVLLLPRENTARSLFFAARRTNEEEKARKLRENPAAKNFDTGRMSSDGGAVTMVEMI